MDIVWLKDFLALAQEGNFSRAAETRNLSQPAFSRRIKALEDWVGVTLIDRDTHRITLTESGAAFRSVVEDVLNRLAIGRDEARQIADSGAATLRFAATHTLSVTFFPVWLRGFEERGELGTVNLIADNMVACERLMLEGRADMLLCHHHPAASNRLDPAAFRSIRLGSDMLVPVSIPVDGNPRFALPGGTEGPPPYLQFDEQSGMGRILEATGIIQDSGVALRPVFRSHLASVLLHMARNGRGIAWSPLSLCEEDLRTGRLVRAGDDRWAVPFDIMLFRPRARRNAAVEGFWQRLVENAAADANDLM